MSRKALLFDESAFKHPFFERSGNKVVFSKHRAEYLRSVEEFIKKACDLKKIEFSVDYDDMVMEVSTTTKTRDPYIIVKGGDMIQLLSKGVPLEKAASVLEDEVFCEILPTNLLCSSEKVFERRKGRISHPKTLQAIELLTKCAIFVSGKVVCIIGNYKGLNDAKNIAIACFEKNIHPIFEVKKLIIKKRLEKDKVEGDWERFLPKVKKTHSRDRVKWREGGKLPADVRPRKEDVQRETGEYYTDQKNVEKDQAREAARVKRELHRKARAERYVIPDE